MRKVYIFILVLLFILITALSPMVAYAHPGRTDSKGGHMNRKTGEYHYHNGGSTSADDSRFSVFIFSASLTVIIIGISIVLANKRN